MKLSDQVITLEQAKRLKELGVNGPAILWHVRLDGEWKIENCWGYDWEDHPGYSGAAEMYPAYNVAELGVMVNPYAWGSSFYNDMGKKDGKHWAHTWHNSLGAGPILGWFKTEAQARGSMLIHLLESSLITVEEVNKRLK